MKLYAGIDLHANNSVVVVIDEEDRVLYQKRLRNELRGDSPSIRSVSRNPPGDRRGIDLQLVLAGGWAHGRGLSSAFGEHDGD